MHPLFEKADRLSREVIGAAIEVHRHMGAGLIESIYERCMLHELELRSIPCVTQKVVRIEYKGIAFEEPLRFDVLVDGCLLLELKAVKVLHPFSKAQLFSYMKLLDVPVGTLDPLSRAGPQEWHLAHDPARGEPHRRRGGFVLNRRKRSERRSPTFV